jgi:DNA polymerase III epsilon subunit-like protein
MSRDVTSPICTLRLSRYLLPELEQHKLQYLRYYFGIEFAEKPQTHDALGDVLVLEKVFYKLHELLKRQRTTERRTRTPKYDDRNLVSSIDSLYVQIWQTQRHALDGCTTRLSRLGGE